MYPEGQKGQGGLDGDGGSSSPDGYHCWQKGTTRRSEGIGKVVSGNGEGKVVCGHGEGLGEKGVQYHTSGGGTGGVKQKL